MYYTYILRLNSSKSKYYIGYSSDLRERIATHKSVKVSSTKNNLPIKLIFYAAFEKKVNAVRFEKYLKSSSGFAFRNKRLI